jgi:hypothetical protein
MRRLRVEEGPAPKGGLDSSIHARVGWDILVQEAAHSEYGGVEGL